MRLRGSSGAARGERVGWLSVDCERWAWAVGTCDGALGRCWGVGVREPSGQAHTEAIGSKRSSIDPPRGRPASRDRRARDAIARPSAATTTACDDHELLDELPTTAASAPGAAAITIPARTSTTAHDRCTCGVARGAVSGERVGWLSMDCETWVVATWVCDGALGRYWDVYARVQSGQARTEASGTDRSSIDPPRGRPAGGDRRAHDAIARPLAATATASDGHQRLVESPTAAASAPAAGAITSPAFTPATAHDRCACGIARGRQGVRG